VNGAILWRNAGGQVAKLGVDSGVKHHSWQHPLLATHHRALWWLALLIVEGTRRPPTTHPESHQLGLGCDYSLVH
jgi:hypothetical protein